MIWRLMCRPRPRALRLAGQRVARLAELLEDHLLVLRADAGAVVAHVDPQDARLLGQRDLDPAAPRLAELGRVGQQVQHHLHRCGRGRRAPAARGPAGRARARTLRSLEQLAGRRRGVLDHLAHVEQRLVPLGAARLELARESSTWLMSRVSRSVSLMTMPRKLLALRGRQRRGLSCRISVNARIEVSGVRSSCVTVETKSSFRRSSSCSRSLAARSSCVARLELAATSAPAGGCRRRPARPRRGSSRTSSSVERLFLHHRGDHDARRGGADRAGELQLDEVHQLRVGGERSSAQLSAALARIVARTPRRRAPGRGSAPAGRTGRAPTRCRARSARRRPRPVCLNTSTNSARLAVLVGALARRAATRRRRRRCWRACSRSWRA